MQSNALQLVLMGCDYPTANALFKNTGLCTLEKAEKTPVGLWLAHFKAQSPFSKLQRNHISMHGFEMFTFHANIFHTFIFMPGKISKTSRSARRKEGEITSGSGRIITNMTIIINILILYVDAGLS